MTTEVLGTRRNIRIFGAGSVVAGIYYIDCLTKQPVQNHQILVYKKEREMGRQEHVCTCTHLSDVVKVGE